MVAGEERSSPGKEKKKPTKKPVKKSDKHDCSSKVLNFIICKLLSE